MALSTTLPASAQPFQHHGLNFVTVGDPGNRGATAAEAPLWPTWAPPLGAVDHTFGIMRTNVTNAQWIEFVRAYGQHYPGNPSDLDLTGQGIFYTGTVGGVRQFEVIPGSENFSADTTWRIAARFTNWLHNDKALDPAAFEDGAYDTSTFGVDAQGRLTDQPTHHPDARFWIPTTNEYTKAAHWDPDKHGPGEGGYWLMPDGGDERLIAGPPGVGECAGDWAPFPWYVGVELYPETQSPWGMLDVSSTIEQHTQGWDHPSLGTDRLQAGSRAGSFAYWVADRLDNFGSSPVGGNSGFRIVSAVPSPSAVAVLGLAALTPFRRRRT